MKLGDKGDKISSLQKALTAVGYSCTIDGDFGPETEAAVKSLQEKNGLLVDGVVGPKTLGKIDQLEAALRNGNAGSSPSPATPSTLARGLDGYHGDDEQQKADWVKAKAAGYSFAIWKATEGLNFRDKSQAREWAAMKAAGVIRGVYHFLRCNHDGAAQAQYFLNAISQQQVDDLPCTLDFETMDGVNADTAVNCALAWGRRIKEVTKKTPLLYTMPNQLHVCSKAAHFHQLAEVFQLWLAAPGHVLGKTVIPAPFKKIVILQDRFGEKGTGKTPGFPVSMDTDVFNGTVEELQAFAKQVR